ncbi:hypothetical protein [Bradyrhizobium cenepequi]
MGKISESAQAENMLSALRSASSHGNLGRFVADAASYLSALADQLDAWAEESKNGGWSTHQVQANIATANSCRRVAARLRSALQ